MEIAQCFRCIRVLLSNSLIPQIREILDFRARSADASFKQWTTGIFQAQITGVIWCSEQTVLTNSKVFTTMEQMLPEFHQVWSEMGPELR